MYTAGVNAIQHTNCSRGATANPGPFVRPRLFGDSQCDQLSRMSADAETVVSSNTDGTHATVEFFPRKRSWERFLKCGLVQLNRWKVNTFAQGFSNIFVRQIWYRKNVYYFLRPSVLVNVWEPLVSGICFVMTTAHHYNARSPTQPLQLTTTNVCVRTSKLPHISHTPPPSQF